MSAVIENIYIPRFPREPVSAARSYTSKNEPQAPRIDIHDDYQLMHLCRLYGVNSVDVRRAVDQVGDDRSAVVQRLLGIR